MLNLINGSIILTERCNLDCTFCYEKSRFQNDMDKDIVVKVINFMNSHYTHFKGCKRNIMWFGGEPFLNFETLLHGYDYAKESGYKGTHGIMTNATICSDKILQEISIRPNLQVQLSWQGLAELQESFRGEAEIVEENIKRFLQLPNNIHIQIQVLPQSVDLLIHAVTKIYKTMGNKTGAIEVRPVPEVEGWNSKTLLTLNQSMSLLAKRYGSRLKRVWLCANGHFSDELYCSPGKGFAAFSPSGDIYPCHRFYFLKDSRFKLGDVKSGLVSTGISMDLDRMHRYCYKGCETCVAEKTCFVCPAFNYENTGSLTKTIQQNCDVNRAYASALAPYINQKPQPQELDIRDYDDKAILQIAKIVNNCFDSISSISNDLKKIKDQEYFDKIDWKNRRF